MALGNFNGGLGFGLAFALQDKFTNVATKIKGSMKSLSSAAAEGADKISKNFGVADEALGSLGLSFSFSDAITEAAMFSDKLVDVSEATGLSASEIEKLRTELEGLDTRRNITELLDLASAGKQMGVANEELSAFTKNADMAAVALGGDFGENAVAVSKKIVQMQKAFGDTKNLDINSAITRIGSALGEMGDTTGVSTAKIADFATKLGQINPNITAAQALGLGTALEQLGIKSKAATGVIAKVLQSAGDTKKMGAFASQIGVSNKEFEKLINTNPNEVLIRLAKSMKGMSATDVSKTLKKLNLSGKDSAMVMQTLANNIELVEKNQLGAAEAFQEGTGLQDEFNKRNNTLGAVLQRVQRNFQILKIRIGEAIGEGLKPLFLIVNDIIMAFNAFAATPAGKFILKLVGLAVGLVTSLLAVFKVIGMISSAMKFLQIAVRSTLVSFAPFLAILLPIVLLVSLIQRATDAFAAFDGEIQTGFGGFLQKLGGVIAAIKEIWSSWDSVNGTFSMSSGLVDKLNKLGILEVAVNIGTWIVRIKEFFIGLVSGVKAAFKFVWSIIKAVLSPILNFLKQIGISFDKTTSSTKAWGVAGQIAGAILIGILAAITIALGVMAINSLIAFLPMLIVIGLIGLAIYAIVLAVGWVIDAFSSMWDWVSGMVDIGAQIVQNIWDGMKSMWGAFTSWLDGALESVPILGWGYKGAKSVANWASIDMAETVKLLEAKKANSELQTAGQGANNAQTSSVSGMFNNFRENASGGKGAKKEKETSIFMMLDKDVMGKAIMRQDEEETSRK
jgi:TP901 family phage tail tape measure protein